MANGTLGSSPMENVSSRVNLFSITRQSCRQNSRFFSNGVNVRSSISCNLNERADVIRRSPFTRVRPLQGKFSSPVEKTGPFLLIDLVGAHLCGPCRPEDEGDWSTSLTPQWSTFAECPVDPCADSVPVGYVRGLLSREFPLWRRLE